MADTLTTAEKAPIMLADDTPVGFPAYSLAPCDDETVAHATNDGSTHYVIEAVSVGRTTYTVTRVSDGATATGTVTVTADGGFTVHLGTPVPK